ncbi:putative RNAse H [Alkalihalophilus pseudofirmus OF4]|uniref:RNAse H n=2 Tax=Alkalihalophilus pseudofirmus TaxID=79885 RepID=D3FXC8_ALKPO|nr:MULTISPECIES: DUF4440 domain-containing protein [Alkalihalophilus]ADC50639.1 putative RNAse H [Alkalihalophilus pseudofirmus OF4]MDV2883780.1 DUF4440 domain-containing protein [Alkalihalophilus pseudofirmus]MED1602662.1 DUF4440 domain-containing protein [Alkalihalophilus marmarensis]OLS34401.1 DUF4440 domain-containing protein [Alkalihalophilus pseudofirmus]
MNSIQTLKQTILLLEEKLLQSHTRTSPEQLEELLADDFLEFASSGQVWVRDDCLGEGGVGVVSMKIYDFEIRQLAPEVILATYRVFDEHRVSNTIRSSIWKKENGNWKMSFHQGTYTKS